MRTAQYLLAGTVLAGSLGMSVPASAQRLTFGPDGPGLDLRSRGERMRDREMMRRDRDRDDYYREQRYRDRDRGGRRGYDY